MSSRQDTFCVLPWMSLQIRPDGTMAACPISQKKLSTQSGEESLYLYRNQLSEAIDSPTLKSLQKNLLQGVKDDNCSICWQDEACGRKSKRLIDNELFHEQKMQILNGTFPTHPGFLDISPGNHCNLKCRICSGWNSSKWIGELEEVYGQDFLPRNNELRELSPKESRDKLMGWPEKKPGFWEELEEWLPGLHTISFYGGEPFLNKRHFSFLEKAVASGDSKHLTIFYNTNGTVFPTEAIEKIFPHFKKVQVFLSLDGIGNRFEYQRFGAKWPTVAENLKKFRALSSLHVAVCLSVSAINIFYVPETLDFFLKEKIPVFFNLVHFPAHFSIQSLPASTKKKLLEQWRGFDWKKYQPILLNDFEPILEVMMAADHPQEWEKFQSVISKHDAFRHQSFAKEFPEFLEILPKPNQLEQVHGNSGVGIFP